METSLFELQTAAYYDQRSTGTSHASDSDSLFGSDDFELDATLHEALLSPSALGSLTSPLFHPDFCFSAPPACSVPTQHQDDGLGNSFTHATAHMHALSAYATHALPSPYTTATTHTLDHTVPAPALAPTYHHHHLSTTNGTYAPCHTLQHQQHEHQHQHQHHQHQHHGQSRSAGVSVNQQHAHTSLSSFVHTQSAQPQFGHSHDCTSAPLHHQHSHDQHQHQHHHCQQQAAGSSNSSAHSHHHADLFPWPEYVDMMAEALLDLPSIANIPLSPLPPAIECTSFLAEYEPHGVCIGSGLSGGVHPCVRRCDGAMLAFKMLPHEEDSLRELAIWAACTPHPNVVDIVTVFDNIVPADHPLLAGRPAGRYLIVVMPKMHGDLFDYLQVREDHLLPFSESELCVVAQQLSSVLAHIHTRGFVHGDIKLENVLLESPRSLHIRICDFGFARLAAHTPTKRQFTRYYVSPEAIRSYEHKDRHNMFLHFGASSDIWALGVALYILFFSVPPFDSLPHEPGCHDSKTITPHMRRSICKGAFTVAADRWLSLSGEARHFFTSILNPTTELRPTAHHLLSFPWFASISPAPTQAPAPAPVPAPALVHPTALHAPACTQKRASLFKAA